MKTCEIGDFLVWNRCIMAVKRFCEIGGLQLWNRRPTTWNTAIFPYFPLKITYFPLFFTLFPQKILDMQGKGTLFRPHKSKFRSYISQSKDDTKFLLAYICVLRCRLNTSRFRAWYCWRTTPWMDECALIIFLKRQAIR